MKRTSILLTMSLSIFFLVGCSEKQEQDNQAQKATDRFILNDGQKWQMDQHTRTAINKIDSLLYVESAFESADAYKLFAEKLDDELILLIRGCTMEGAAHDQLHIFLGYFYPMIQNLKKENNLEKSKMIVSQMMALFKEYHNFFE